MVLIPYNQSRANDDYRNNFEQSGGINVYAGSQFQKGHGIGNVLSGLFRSALPLIKKGAASLGKTAIQTGVNILNDGLQGKNLKASIKQNAKQAGKEILSNAVKSVTSRSQSNRRDFSTPTLSYSNKKPNKKRKLVTMSVSRSSPPKKRRAKNRRTDIFG